MATTMNCPNCGSQLAPGATACARCGHELGPTPAGDAATSPAPTPTSDPPESSTKPAAPIAINFDFAAIRSRLGLQQTPVLTAAIVLAVAGFVIGTFAHIKYLTADAGDFVAYENSQAVFQLALGCVVATLALCILLRWQSGPLPRGDEESPDRRIALGIGGLTIAFAFLAFVFGMSTRFEASDSWFRYAQLYAFITASWLTIARPVPANFGSTGGATPVLVVIGAGLAALVIGAFMAQSDNFDSWVKGISLESAGLVALVLVVGVLLGLEERRGVVTSG